jgi:hypothetical protein
MFLLLYLKYSMFQKYQDKFKKRSGSHLKYCDGNLGDLND